MDFPRDLIERRQWCTWVNSGGTKIPLQVSGQPAKSNDPSTFCAYADVANLDRKAFMIQATDPFVGTDLDNCLDEDGCLLPWAEEIVARLKPVSYGEISPSGRGIKFLTRATKPGAARCVFKVDESLKQQIECYGDRRFWTMTGIIVSGFREIPDGQEAIDWLCDKYLIEKKPEGNLQGFTTSDNPTVARTSITLVERAQKYVENADLPVSDRNNALFRLAGHLASLDDNGVRLTDDQILSLGQYWNSRLPDPLSEREAAKAIRSALRNGTPRDVKPTTSDAVDQSPTIHSVPASPLEEIEVDMSILLDDETIDRSLYWAPGTISKIMEYNLDTALYPLEDLAFAGALALMSVITGRKIQDEHQGRTNMFIIGLAPSGSGKEHARLINKQLLFSAGGERYIGPERIGSHAGIVSVVADQPAVLFQLDEMGRLLKALRDSGAKAPYLANIATVLMQLYGCSNQQWISDAYAETKKTRKINQPHPVIYGTSVVENFWSSLTAENVSDGLVGRILAFESGYVDPQKPKRYDPGVILIDHIKHWVNFSTGEGNLCEMNPTPKIIKYAPDARSRMDDHMLAVAAKRKQESREKAAVWSRSPGKAAKLALIFAASRAACQTDFMIELEDVDRAIKLSNQLTRRTLNQVFEHVVDNDLEGKVRRVWRMFKDGPRTQTEYTRKTQWLTKRERVEILETLMNSGQIIQEQIHTSGRFKTIYRIPTR